MQWWQHNSSLSHLLRSVFWHLCSSTQAAALINSREPLPWDMVTPCSGWALCSISCLPSIKSLVVPLPCYLPWGTLGKAFTLHTGKRSELIHWNQRKAPTWQGYPLPERAAFMNTHNNDLKSIVKNRHDWNSYLGLLFGDFHPGHRDAPTVLGTETQHDLPLRISHHCPLST